MNSLKEILVTIFVIIFGVLAINPFSLSMSVSTHMTVFVLLLIAVVVFAGFIIGETIHDEREYEHRNFAGRISYVIGLLTLIFAVLFQAFSHKVVDSWLIVTLIVMIVAKVIAHIYSREYR